MRNTCRLYSVMLAFAFWPVVLASAAAQTTAPKSISDIIALLDQEKKDPAKLARLHADADASVPTGASPNELSKFYFKRSEARQVAGRLQDARADANAGLAIDRSKVEPRQLMAFRSHAGWLHRNAGETAECVKAFKDLERDADKPGSKGALFHIYKHLTYCLQETGDLVQAETYVQKAVALTKQSRDWPPYKMYGSSWESHTQELLGFFYRTKGQHRESEEAFQRSVELARDALKVSPTWEVPPLRGRLEYLVDYLLMNQGRAKALQGRAAEAEADIRRALLSSLKINGKYNTAVVSSLSALAYTLVDQGRIDDAGILMRICIGLWRDIGLPESSNHIAQGLLFLVGILNQQSRWSEAALIYREIDAATQNWDRRRKDRLELNAGRIYMLYNTGNLQDGVMAAKRFRDRSLSLFGEKHFKTAIARGVHAIGLARSGTTAEAMEEFKKSVDFLLTVTFDNDDDDATAAASGQVRIREIVEVYMGLLADRGAADPGTVNETFRLAEVLRGSSVQKALVSASTRMAANSPSFGGLTRKDDELDRQWAALLTLLNSVLSRAAEERDEAVVSSLRKQVETLRAARVASSKEIERRFPRYADLINPKPPTLDEVRKSLNEGDAFVSFYFGRFRGYVWVVPKSGPPVFSAIQTNLQQIDDRVTRVRKAFDASLIMGLADILPFEFDIAHGLYNILFKPVAASWRDAKHLIVAANGALGMLPLGLLTTELFTPGKSEVAFADYRGAPWLARTHAITFVPSAASLVTLHSAPRGSAARQQFIGFGDPIFSKDQLTDGEQKRPDGAADSEQRGIRVARRSLPNLKGVDSAELDRLPRLPDTADELRSVAAALQLDPTKVLHLGRAANERTVKAANLAQYRLLAFATHGLVPGELNGLTEPALALSAPIVADVDGDGLLTMSEILALKLDADWVILSACNTASGVREGAEAASGLGRAFFYAGARSLVLTSWAVYSVPAAQLIGDLFRRQSMDASLTRAEALRQSMMSLADGTGFVDQSGKEVASFAHPVFWAPYTLVGNGGKE